MHKITNIGLILLIVILSGCQSKVNMDQLDEDSLYHYKNQDFKFSIDLPPEFIYYQTQRIAQKDYTDIEFYIPTSDTGYPTRVPSYGLVVTIRIFNTNEWQQVLENQINGESYEWLSEEANRVYTARFWQKIPSDWQDKWSDEMKQNIKNSFKLN